MERLKKEIAKAIDKNSPYVGFAKSYKGRLILIIMWCARRCNSYSKRLFNMLWIFKNGKLFEDKNLFINNLDIAVLLLYMHLFV